MNPSRTLFSVRLLACLALALFPFGSGLRAEDAAVLTAPSELHAGGTSSVTVTTLDAATRDPITRPVTITLVSSDESFSTKLFDGDSGPGGHRSVQFDVPSVPGGSYLIRANVSGVDEPLEVSTTLSRTPAILIETDKPIYKPSQTIQGRVILLDNQLCPQTGEVEVTFHDGKGIRIDRRNLTANEYGVASFSLDLARELNLGTWKIKATSEGVESVRDVRVEEYTLPRFDLKTALPRSWSLVDEPITGTVEARYFFGKDVDGTATVVAKRWVGTWEEYATASGPLSGGEFEFTVDPVGFVSGTPGSSGQGTVTIDVSVTDSTDHTEKTSEVVTIVEAPLVLTLVSRARSLKPEIPADVVVTTKSPDGAPLALEVETTTTFFSMSGDVLGESSRSLTTQNGTGILTVVPPQDTSYAEVSARASRDGHNTSTMLRINAAYSPSSSFLSLARTDGEGEASVGQVVTFTAVSTHRATVYYEVYAGGRTILSGASESDSFSFAVTPQMTPLAKVVAYKINPDNEVAADSVALEVGLPLSVSVSAGFSAEKVKPGDPVEVTVDTGLGRRALLGISVVDQSVLALGRSRLHLADVFAELERRFMEPKAEVHEGPGGPPGPVEGGPGGPMIGDFWGGEFPRTQGALDVLEDAGLAVAVSKGLTVPEGADVDFWRWAEDAAGPGEPPPAAGGEGGPDEPPVRLRQYFPETWVWEPLQVTDEEGRVTLELTAPDSITSWKLAVVGTAPCDGEEEAGIVFGESELTVFQDFFVEPSIPYSVVRGETFPVKVDVFNYLETEQDISLEFADSDGFEILEGANMDVTVPAGSAISVHFPIRPTGLGEFPVQITARGATLSDAVLRPIKVVPEGNPTEEIANGVIEPGTTVPIDVSMPLEAVVGSERAYLHIVPSPVAQTMNGVSDLLGMPYGCGEQNMIFLAPDIEILKYLRETGELSPEIRASAEYYVNVGYQRELTFMSDDKGFAAFGGEHGSLWLTAFVLSTFSGAREVRDIDESVLAGAAGMLISRQNADGSFQTDDFLIHKEMDGGMENVYAMAGFVTGALADYVTLAPDGVEPSSEVMEGLAKATAYLESSWTSLPGISDDPYSLAIAASALVKAPGGADSAEAILDRLLDLAIREGVGMHWEPYPVEATGYAAMALLAANGGAGRPEAAAAVEWISAQRNALGGFGQSTQDTVVAIRALFLAARKVHVDLDVTLSVLSGDDAIATYHVDATNYDLFHAFELPLDASDPAGGDSGLRLASEGTGNVGYQVVKRYNVPVDLLPPPHDMLINVEYNASHIEVDDLVDVQVTLKYTGLKEKTGMVIADVAVPTGFGAVKSSLDALVDAETVSRVELAGRKVIFYVDSLTSGTPLSFAFEVLALYPVRAEGTFSRVYEYYDPDVEAYDGVGSLVIHERPSTPPVFLRSDSNGDGKADLSDAVLTLNYLFLGGVPPACLDAADVNDDGKVNITDPIHLLQHLFLGGPAPEAPYPEPGSDPSGDSLGC